MLQCTAFAIAHNSFSHMFDGLVRCALWPLFTKLKRFKNNVNANAIEWLKRWKQPQRIWLYRYMAGHRIGKHIVTTNRMPTLCVLQTCLLHRNEFCKHRTITQKLSESPNGIKSELHTNNFGKWARAYTNTYTHRRRKSNLDGCLSIHNTYRICIDAIAIHIWEEKPQRSALNCLPTLFDMRIYNIRLSSLCLLMIKHISSCYI